MPFRASELEQVNQDVAAAQAQERERMDVELQLQRARESLGELKERIARLERGVGAEARDVARLEGGVLAFLHRALGTLEEKRSKERQELATAELKLSEAHAERAVIAEEIAALTERAAALVEAPVRLSVARAAKEQWLRAHDEAAAHSLAQIGADRAAVEAERVGLLQARVVADDAHAVVEDLLGSLDSARAWSAADLLGGGVVVSLAKGSHLDAANAVLPRLERLVLRLKRACDDVGIAFSPQSLDLAVDGRFVDVFFDNLITDWTSDSQINRARGSVLELRRLVAGVLRAIAARGKELDPRLEELANRRERLLAG